ncbi:DUF6126 family protein [Streptomyces polygonati]|uniref:DUF6126 family protein n=1 Tax=Streptomyces polygonati TaxID=1617087 RepID=A0ABV8HIS2_9ACTN
MTMHETEPTAQPLAAPAAESVTDPTAPAVVRTTNGTERRKERGVVLRVLVYVVVAHLLAFYLWLMFAVLGKH